MAHPHYKLIKKFAEDAEKYDDPEQFWRFKITNGKAWQHFDKGVSPHWWPNFEYMRVPETITIGGIEAPKPVEEPLGYGQQYWVANPNVVDLCGCCAWTGDSSDIHFLKRRRIHLTKEAAQEYARAEIRLGGGTIEEDK